ncbi:hypothetical protein ES703_101792 [subsurface metagenome]
MWFINNIVTYCNRISDYFYSVYLEVIGWIYPFWYIARFFYYLCDLFNNLAWAFYSFAQWAYDVESIINSWWSSAQYTVLSWIEDAKQWAGAQIDSLRSTINYILAWWDEFKPKIPSIDEILSWFTDWWGKTLANIISWGALTGIQISTLIDSKIKDWLPFYDELAALWGDIKLFFTDPLQWAYDRGEEFFDRFW